MTRPGVVHLLLALLVTWQCGAEDHQDHQHVSSLHLYNECVHQLHAPRVALLFLVRYDLWHRELWRQWLLSASGIAPMAALVQSAHRQSGNMEHAADHIILACINATAANTFATRRQYLFSVHQHISPEVPFDPDAQLGGELLPDNQRIATHWAGTNLVDATRRLLQHALQVAFCCVCLWRALFHPPCLRTPSITFSCCSARQASLSIHHWSSTSSSCTVTPVR